jgi:hypothetical protein
VRVVPVTSRSLVRVLLVSAIIIASASSAAAEFRRIEIKISGMD